MSFFMTVYHKKVILNTHPIVRGSVYSLVVTKGPMSLICCKFNPSPGPEAILSLL